MKKLIFILFILPLFSFANKGIDDDYFNQVELSSNNDIANINMTKYYDTILSVALDAIGITGIKIAIDKITPEADASFSGVLYAHVKYYDGVYYLYIKNNLSREKAIEVISHEVVHIHQYQTGYLSYSDACMCITYGEEIYYLDDIDYIDRPWEEDAYKYEKYVYEQVDKKLVR